MSRKPKKKFPLLQSFIGRFNLKITKHQQRPLFTLTELLVVICVLSILLALLMPALKRLHKKTNELICRNNLHQLGSAAMAFEGDFDKCPHPRSGSSGDFRTKLWPYLGLKALPAGESVYTCPIQYELRVYPTANTYAQNDNIQKDANTQISREGFMLRAPNTIYANPANIPYFMDGAWKGPIYGGPLGAYDWFFTYRNRDMSDAMDPQRFNGHPNALPHDRGTHIYMMDGSVVYKNVTDETWLVSSHKNAIKSTGVW